VPREHDRVSGSESPGRDPRGQVLKGKRMNILYVIGVVVVVLAVLGYLGLG
jgi:hypothetical protein